MHDRLMGLRGNTTGQVLMAAVIVGFALAVGFALGALDTAVKDACSSLAAIATIGT